MTIRTRFAPSPTGDLHIGGVRTALFSYLHAKHYGGNFVLRIEDTDRARSTSEALEGILEGMRWLKLDADEGPFYQTDRFDRYAEVRDHLLASGAAYRCYCTREELDQRREEQRARKQTPRYDGRCRSRTEPRDGVDPVVRFANPREGSVLIDDLVQGRVVVSNSELDDLIISRSDGTPTYNFCVVVDDVDMQITHVIRGDDHLSNTPKQINIMLALGVQPPMYGHVPMILGADGAKLSKRHGAASVLEYRDLGFLPEALLNYLVRLGWSHGDQETFTREQMVELFDLKGVNKSASTFNPDKLVWLNQQYIKSLDPDVVGDSLRFQYERIGVDICDGPEPAKIVTLYRDRAKTMVEMAESSAWFFQPIENYNEKAIRKNIKADTSAILETLRMELEAFDVWQDEAIEKCVQSCMAKHEVKMGAVAQPLRIAISGNRLLYTSAAADRLS